MVLILASSYNCNEKDENGVRHPIPLADTNSFLSNIKKFIPKYDSIVYVANDPDNFEVINEWANIVFTSFELTGLKFKNRIILDSRNKNNARSIVENADLVMLAGGKINCQLDFFSEIGLKELIEKHKGLVIGGSAGSMNLCKTVFNFPEEPCDIDGRKDNDFFQPGLGFFDRIIIPHFNDTEYYQCNAGVDSWNEYIRPLSHGREFLAYDDDSYILINNGKIEYFGTFYKIKDGKIHIIDKKTVSCHS